MAVVIIVIPAMLLLLLGLDFILKFYMLILAVIFVVTVIFLITRFIIYKTWWAYKTIKLSPYEDYSSMLSEYMKVLPFVDSLENDNLVLLYTKDHIIKAKNKNNNKSYKITQDVFNNSKITTVWGLIQMSFSENLTYGGLRFWLDGFEDIRIYKL